MLRNGRWSMSHRQLESTSVLSKQRGGICKPARAVDDCYQLDIDISIGSRCTTVDKISISLLWGLADSFLCWLNIMSPCWVFSLKLGLLPLSLFILYTHSMNQGIVNEEISLPRFSEIGFSEHAPHGCLSIPGPHPHTCGVAIKMGGASSSQRTMQKYPKTTIWRLVRTAMDTFSQ